MSIELAKKNFIELKKVANEAVDLVGLGNQKAKVALALDISGSMSNLFTNGTVQEVVEELLALGVKFDDNKAIDIFLFGSNNYEVGELQEDDFYNYVKREITPKYPLEGSTNYAGVMKRIVNKYVPNYKTINEKKGLFGKLFKSKEESGNRVENDPVFVIFVTDGDNQDKPETEEIIREASRLGIFWQFVGVGSSSFSFLQKLDNLNGRELDNADFFQMNDISTVNKSILFKKLLNGFPTWLKQAADKNYIN